MNITLRKDQQAPNQIITNNLVSFQTRMARHIRYFDKNTCEFIGQKAITSVNDNYLRKIFGLAKDNPMLFSYPVTQKQKEFIERLTGLELNLDSYQYFMECDFRNADY